MTFYCLCQLINDGGRRSKMICYHYDNNNNNNNCSIDEVLEATLQTPPEFSNKTTKLLKVDSSLELQMTCMGSYEIKRPIYKKFIKLNKCILTNAMLENGLMYLYQVIQLDVINGWLLKQVAKSTKDEGGNYNCENLQDGCKLIKWTQLWDYRSHNAWQWKTMRLLKKTLFWTLSKLRSIDYSPSFWASRLSWIEWGWHEVTHIGLYQT